MSIAWKAKWGQLPNDLESPAYTYSATAQHIFANIRQIDWSYMNVTDDSWFSMATSLDTTQYPLTKATAEALAVAISDTMDIADFGVLMASCSVGSTAMSESNVQTMMRMVPTIFRQIPNLVKLQMSADGSKVLFCWIPSLDRVIAFGDWHAGGGHYSIFKYSSGERQVNGPSGIGAPDGMMLQCANNAFISVCHGYDGTKESLLTSNNYSNINIWWASNPQFGARIVRNDYSFFYYLFGDFSPPDYHIPTNPYDPIDPSGPTDPDSPPGDFDDESDPIPDSPIPTLSSANTGFTRIYNPTLAQVRELANYLWTDETVISTIWNHIKQYFEDPMQAIIGFNLVPVPVPDGGIEEFKLMYIGTGVNMTVAASQFVDIDCGTLELKPYYGSYLDYAPYTKISCFLPYIGNVEINPDEVMNTTLQVKYRVDICSGSCVAKILVDNNCLYQYSGHCAIPIPFASADFSSYVSAAISVAKLGVGVATAGALGAAGLEAGEVAQATTAVTTTNTERNPATGRQITLNTQTVSTESSRETKPSPASYAGITPRNVSNTVGQIMGSKPAFQHSGSFSGNTGYLGVRRPFLIITRPNLCLPESYKAMNGYPAMITMNLSDCTGFTQVQQIQFSGSSATNPEVDEILQFLKSGVIF